MWITYWIISDEIGSSPIPLLYLLIKIYIMTEVKTFELVHGCDKETTIKTISEVLEAFGLTIHTLEIGDERTTYSIEVLN